MTIIPFLAFALVLLCGAVTHLLRSFMPCPFIVIDPGSAQSRLLFLWIKHWRIEKIECGPPREWNIE